MRAVRLPSGKEVIVEVTRTSVFSKWLTVAGLTTRLADGMFGELFQPNAKGKIPLRAETKIGEVPAVITRRLDEVATTVSLRDPAADASSTLPILMGQALWKRHEHDQLVGSTVRTLMMPDGEELTEEFDVFKKHDALSKRTGKVKALEDMFAKDNRSDVPVMAAGFVEAFGRFMKSFDAAHRAAENVEDIMDDMKTQRGADMLREGLVDVVAKVSLLKKEIESFIKNNIVSWEKDRRILSRADRQFLVAYVIPAFASDSLLEEVERCTRRLPDPAKTETTPAEQPVEQAV